MLTDKALLKIIDKVRRGKGGPDKLVATFGELRGVSDETLQELAELLVERLWLQHRPAYWSHRELWPAMAKLPERVFAALCGAVQEAGGQEAGGDFPDAKQSAATFLFSEFSARGKVSQLTPSAKNIAIFRQRCKALGELAFCPEQPDGKDAARFRRRLRSYPELNAHVKATVLFCLDGLQTSRAVDRGLVLWLAMNADDGVPAPKKKVAKKKAAKKKAAKKTR